MGEASNGHKGRGAQSNPENRFWRHSLIPEEPAQAPSPVTECRAVNAKSIISRNNSPDVPFSQSINPYQGCEHGCIYCYARPSHAYHDLSPGLDFETRLMYKANAAEVLERELQAKHYQCQPITLGANTDPYQPVEKQLGITRAVLQVLQRYRHPVNIITKASLISRDIDLLEAMAADSLVSVAISVTTLNDQLKRQLEPRASTGSTRLATISQLAQRKIPVTVLVAPIIPAINDAEMEAILQQSAAAGAVQAAYILLRLPLEVQELFAQWLQQHYPLRAKKVTSILRQCRGGGDYDSRFGHRMRGTGTFADLLSLRFSRCCRRLGLNTDRQLSTRTDLFTAPGQQQTLF